MLRIVNDGLDKVACPGCGFENGMHQDRVVVYTRVEDDPESVADIRTPEFRGDASRVPPNPGYRRDGVVIEGWCEGCSGRWALALGQRKGTERITMEMTGEKVYGRG